MRYSCTALLGLLFLGLSVNANRYRDEYIAEASQQGARFAASANSYFAPSSYSISGPGFSSADSEQIYNAGNMRSDLPSDVPYWWMNNGSPFKHQNHGSKDDNLNEKGVAASNNVEIRKSEGYEMDLSKNPFFNGNYVAAASAPAAAQHHLTAAATQINVASNPFLNGNSASFGASGPTVQFGLTAPASNQFGGSAQGGFRQGGSSFSGSTPSGFGQSQFSSSSIKSTNGNFQSNLIAGSTNSKPGFVQGQTKFTSSGSDFGAATHNGYLPPEPSTIRCYGQGKTCAPKQQCAGGYISEYSVDLNSIRNNDDQFCNIELEVCCSIQYATTVRPTQPPQPQSTPCLDREYTCVAPDLCRNGVIRVNSNALRDQLSPANQKCYAPEVCCRYPDETFSPNQLIPNELRPTSTPAPYIPPSPPVTTQRPYVPPVTTQRPYVPLVTTQRPYVPPVTTQRPYVPPVTTQRPYVPPVTTQRPYVPPVTTQRPYVPPVTTRAPYVGNQYIPPVDKDGQPSNNQGTNILPPYKGQDTLSEPNQPAAANNRPTFVNPNIAIDLIPTSCAAALNCTEEQFCNMTGFISKTPVILTPLEKQNQVPMTDCRIKKTNTIGKCCRDADYTDPWPVGQLGQYNPQILNKAFNDGSYKPVNGNGKLSASNINRQVIRPSQPSGTCCTRRDLNSQPRGAGPIDTGFGEIPWQAMILFEPNRTLVCGGSIIQDDVIITAAHCTYGLPARDIMIKGGEWRLGVDEEPKTFQIVRVKTISYHPLYNPATLSHDVALLHLEEKIRFDTHMSPICLDETEPAPTANCITTGWGKEVLRINIQNALMHWSPVGIRPHNECEGTFGNNYNKKVTVCGKTKADSCDVDVGSALACVDSNGCYKLMGVYSTESQCGASPSQLTTFARIDLKWIGAAIKNPGADVLPEYVPEPNNPYEYKAILPSTQAPLYLPPQ